jgi:hypothetical protein
MRLSHVEKLLRFPFARAVIPPGERGRVSLRELTPPHSTCGGRIRSTMPLTMPISLDDAFDDAYIAGTRYGGVRFRTSLLLSPGAA